MVTEHLPPEIEQLSHYLHTALDVVSDVAPLLTLAAVTGLRPGELRGFRRLRLLVDQLMINVDSATDRSGLKPTKTRRNLRLPLTRRPCRCWCGTVRSWTNEPG